MSLREKLVALPIPRIARLTAVVAIAMAAGHLVQSMAAHQPAAPVMAEAEVLPTHIVQLSSTGVTEPALPMPNPEPHVLALEAAPVCETALTLRALPQGMMDVVLQAPCHTGQRVVLRQADLAITLKLGADGKAALVLPALTVDGVVSVLFGDGTRVQQALAMPEVATLKRFGVQWQGADAFALHAMEQGADYGQLSGGVLTQLGDATVDNPLLAEIYTYPSQAAQPDIVVEAAILPETCGHDLLGEVLISQDGRVTATDLTLSMPDCSAVGDFLVLKNLASDMKIAAN
jgi:hypothetical protein